MRQHEEDPLTVIVFAEDSLSRHGLAAILELEPAIVAVLVETPAQLTEDKSGNADVLVWDMGWDFSSHVSAEVWETVGLIRLTAQESGLVPLV
ncbi:MAG: hypothetical protein F4148_08660 [Caldilineaceae bacterium SB0675_bin_29]|uniref:Response regulator transcription factor n=1 Tax=Caldilineaceae bacterium SB0675_bin_29 TaxID=2605266 RepID=A0A6B1G105_9CHLR|nr:hypothetical protein [Caldilineaceae bacterium SB0675_bin_29]